MNNIHFPQIITPIILILLLSSQPTRAQPSDPSGPGNNLGPDGGRFSPSMGVIIIVLIAALFFMGFFSIYIRHCSDNPSTVGVPGRGIGSVRRSRRAPRGLDAEVIESFPTFDYVSVKNAKIGKGALECAVCLTEFEDDDTLRLIPKCDHVFHPDCIDAWLIGHTTCPVCRCNLADDTPIISIEESNHVVVEVDELRSENYNNNDNNNNNNENEESTDSMEQPLHGRTMSRSRTVRNVSFGRPRWLGKLTRSLTTGHVAVKQWENMERFTLRLPDEVRKQIMSGKLVRTTSLVVLPRETSSRRGYRTGFGEGSSRGRSDRPDRSGRSDRWVFSLAPPFFTRAPSIKSPKIVDNTNTSRAGSLRGGSIRENVTSITSYTSREGSLRGAVQAELTHLPV